jgi:diaminobutyrate-2-oxoglutarate transaminase
MPIYEELESAVRTYSRSFPVVFDKASGYHLQAADGRRWIDFLCGAGSLNYGHNPPELVEAVVRYLRDGGVVNSLDLATTAKEAFLEIFRDVILRPRKLDYVVQFTGPTGTNAVEAALKLARLKTGRRNTSPSPTAIMACRSAHSPQPATAASVTARWSRWAM